MKRRETITRIQSITDKSVIQEYLNKEPFLNAYALGDLDPFFWPRTRWLAAYDEDKLLTVVLVYQDDSIPVVLAVDSCAEALGKNLLTKCIGHLPERFYSHLSPSLFASLESYYSVEPHGTHFKMGLTRDTFRKCNGAPNESIRKMVPADLEAILQLYRNAYPGNWFVPKMLETGKYYGVFATERLTGFAGVHVYSKEYGISALGNITVAPDLRGRGLAQRITSVLCEDLLSEIPVVTLNVKADNDAAIRCYESLGFQKVGTYEEALVVRKRA